MSSGKLEKNLEVIHLCDIHRRFPHGETVESLDGRPPRSERARWRAGGFVLGKGHGIDSCLVGMQRLRFLALWLCVSTAWAHDPGLSTLRVEVKTAEISVVAAFAPADADLMIEPGLRGRDFATVQSAWSAAGLALYALSLDEVALAAGTTSTVALRPGDAVEFALHFPRKPGAKLALQANFFPALPPGHRQYAIVLDEAGAVRAEKLLSASDSTLAAEIPAAANRSLGPAVAVDANRVGLTPDPAAPSPTSSAATAPAEREQRPASFFAFLHLGVEHILTGYDHLLFLFGLLLVCSRWRLIFAIITSFTVGHSLTLIAATLDWCTLPPRLIEPAIAASIVYVGVENLWRRGAEPKGRWLLTFFFGLVHGFGFAGVLKELGVGQMGSGLAVPLFSFNLGVELGQIGVAALALPLLWWARKHPAFVKRGVPVLSAIVAAAGLYWFLERTVWS